MPTRFPLPARELLEERRLRVAERLGSGVLVLPGAPIRYRSRDTEYPHRPDSELFWLTGVTEPGAVAVLRGGPDGARLSLFVRGGDAGTELWGGHRPTPERAAAEAGADEGFLLRELEERLPELIDGAPSLHFRLGSHPAVEPAVISALVRARASGPRKGTGPRSVIDPGELLDELRLRKDVFEIERIREAARITIAGFEALEREIGPGVPEWRLQGVLEGTFRAEGGDGPAYGTIVGSGANACVLHYVSNDRVPDPADLVLVDAGSACGLYAADITRTYPAAGRFTDTQRAVYEIVDSARAAAIEAVAPGVTVEAVHHAATEVLVAGLTELGVLSGSGDSLLEREAHLPFYPHRTSHWLGLDVHDVGDYVVRGESRPLEPGMVLTVEPGLYFGESAVETAGGRADAFRGIGVRIEDDILVTADGGENLTAGLPTAADEIERRLSR